MIVWRLPLQEKDMIVLRLLLYFSENRQNRLALTRNTRVSSLYIYRYAHTLLNINFT